MAAIKSIDHKGMEFPSFKAMCEHWEKKPATVKRRLGYRRLGPWPLEMALEIPEIPGYRFKLVMKEPNGTLHFKVKIDKKYIQHQSFNEKWLTFAEIKKNFPKNMKALKKGQMIGIY